MQAELAVRARQCQGASLVNGTYADAVALIVQVLATVIVEALDHSSPVGRVVILETSSRSYFSTFQLL